MVLSEGLSFTGLMREVGMKPKAYPEDTRTFVICNCVFARDGKMVTDLPIKRRPSGGEVARE
jgi:hypothetical protein